MAVILPREMARRVEELPTLPAVAARLLEMIGRDDNSLRDVAKIVQNDAALTARILRVANSAAFSRGKPITSLFRAVMHLGMRIVAGITVGSCASSLMNRRLDGYGSDVGELWNHSLRTAVASREFAFFTNHTVLEDLAFTAGLLHDIGKAVIAEFLAAESETAVGEARNFKVTEQLELERRQLGTDHAEVGLAVAERWGLPKPLSVAIRHHHRPSAVEDSQYRALVYTVHLGDLVAMMSGTGTGSDTMAYSLDEGYQEFIRITEPELSRLLVNVQNEFDAARTIVFG